jgi:hypothetical protein
LEGRVHGAARARLRRIDRVFALVPAQAFVAQWLESFKEFPPRQKPASFSIEQVMQKLQEGGPATR